ncbi:MAG TPA: Fe2+/Zn2+ uptake regulation protein [Desulfobacter sp.]|jgi:Fur family ferric uptake transcriptional regulator|uniref:FeoA domain-containing protein n=1 Tax=unclassified Desulfobacter TaxID=2634406 RepID=UPI000E91A1B9|nr:MULTISPECIES: FeoA domain-containing protein [unclassified Desulfobacter]MBP8829378.1 FeoA domain-containing protein [Desulfobacter sp.]MBP9599810.1 FeoA domain-containing protein [Desulfobacter sp.]HAR33189.1 Fe2+/Zn2+ uptake regulation protein [Desulfobacter sp.]HBT89196.1 Fe2+/Zn2+ uptake regulation protein [Desulfobacter sp.]
MPDRHQQEKDQFRRLFGWRGLDRFEERFQILESFLKLESHVSLAQIADQVRLDGLRVDNEFLLQCMEQLCRLGFASQVVFDRDDTILYEHRQLGVHHDHMVCTKCGAIIEFKDDDLEALQEKLAAEYGFFMLQHKMEIYGLCGECMAQRDDLIPLSRARIGEKVEIVNVAAGRKMQMRFASMGLRTGIFVEIISSAMGGQLVIASECNRLILCAGMASKIWVRPEKGFGGGSNDGGGESCLPFFNESVPMSAMAPGQQGSIARVDGGHFPRRRLGKMGFQPGVLVRVISSSPGSDSIEVMVRGHRVFLSEKDASKIFVENITP